NIRVLLPSHLYHHDIRSDTAMRDLHIRYGKEPGPRRLAVGPGARPARAFQRAVPFPAQPPAVVVRVPQAPADTDLRILSFDETRPCLCPLGGRELTVAGYLVTS